MPHQNITGQNDNEKYNILESRKEIGSTIRVIREKRGMSQEQLAEKMNISRSTISKMESGKFNCSIDYLQRFATHLNFNISLVDLQNSL